tara:strand:- start:197 stop:1318 length:1122 start_codon:yes stop_codon:yes gene_type:complete
MATRGKAPASRTLNYSLTGDIMNRVKGSLDSGSTIKAINEGVSGVADAVSEGSEKLVDERVKIKNKTESADLVFEAGMDAFGSRASWATPETYDKFLEIEEGQRIKYNDAISSNDKKLAAKILREQKQRAVQQQTWKGVFDGLKDIDLLELDDDTKYIVGRMTSQSGEDFKPIYENGEMMIQFNNANGDPIKIRGTEFDKIISQNRKPIKEQEQIALLTQSLMDKKLKMQPFSFSDSLADVKKMITKENINSMMKGQLGMHETGSFLNSIENHPDFTRVSNAGMKLKIGNTDIAADADGDDVISGEEFMNLTADDKKAVIDLMQKPENFDIAQYYLAEFVAIAQQKKLQGYNPRIGNTNKRAEDFIKEVNSQE